MYVIYVHVCIHFCVYIYSSCMYTFLYIYIYIYVYTNVRTSTTATARDVVEHHGNANSVDCLHSALVCEHFKLI